jgi:hypothetical protein
MFFYGPGPGFTTFAPPATGSIGGCAFVNDAGRIAGSYVDSRGTPHGFVYSGGSYVYFGMPAHASLVTVDAYSNTGRAVGSYFDSVKQLWRLFWYNGTRISVFGQFMPQTSVSLALNDNGVLMLGLRSLNGGANASYRILCAGDGC